MNYNIDKLYKTIATKVYFSVKDNNWDEFERLLDKKRRKKEKVFVFFMIDILFLCTLCFWNYSIEDKISSNSAIPQQYGNSISNSAFNRTDIERNIKTNNHPTAFVRAIQKVNFQSSSKLLSSPEVEMKKNAKYNDLFIELKKKVAQKSLLYFAMIPLGTPPVIRLKKHNYIRSPWCITIGLSNGNIYTGSIVSNQNYNSIHHSYIAKKNDGERLHRFISLQLIGNYRIKKYLSVLTGINYTAINQTVKYDFKRTEIPVFDSSGKGTIIGYTSVPANVASPVLLAGYNQYHLLELPLGASLNLKINRRIVATCSMSANVSFLLGNMGQTLNPQTLEVIKLTKDNSSISKLNLSTNTSVGFDYLISNKTYAFVQAQYLKYFSSNSFDKNYKFNTIAIKMGFGFKLYKESKRN